MKKLFRESLILSIFVLSIMLIQMSCSKSDAQQNTPQTTLAQQNKIIYFTEYPANAKIWIANYDGTNATQVPVVLPANVAFDPTVNFQTLRISPDGQTIFFSAYNTTEPNLKPSIYSCDASGNNVKLVVTPPAGGVYLGQAY